MHSRDPAAPGAGLPDFPCYSQGERRADGAVHLLGLAIGPLACAWLLHLGQARADALQLAALAVYGLGLTGMLATSAAYNLAPHGARKSVLRRIDHAMIFVMIAGSYTPFTLNAAAGAAGVLLCIAAWIIAIPGAGLKLAGVTWRPRGWLMLYLGLGWLILPAIPFFLRWFSPQTILLLLAGGLSYSLGSLLHHDGRLRYHNAIWHALVLCGAALHFAAVASLL